jgi:hypothetical protein
MEYLIANAKVQLSKLSAGYDKSVFGRNLVEIAAKLAKSIGY